MPYDLGDGVTWYDGRYRSEQSVSRRRELKVIRQRARRQLVKKHQAEFIEMFKVERGETAYNRLEYNRMRNRVMNRLSQKYKKEFQELYDEQKVGI